MQATVKQVQFLEMVEQRTGVPYTGVKWDIEQVSAYLSANTKPKDANSKQDKKYETQKQRPQNKITDKQKQYIKVLENKTGIFFSGKTFEEAEAYIKENRTA